MHSLSRIALIKHLVGLSSPYPGFAGMLLYLWWRCHRETTGSSWLDTQWDHTGGCEDNNLELRPPAVCRLRGARQGGSGRQYQPMGGRPLLISANGRAASFHLRRGGGFPQYTVLSSSHQIALVRRN